jgi:hypothetical protein
MNEILNMCTLQHSCSMCCIGFRTGAMHSRGYRASATVRHGLQNTRHGAIWITEHMMLCSTGHSKHAAVQHGLQTCASGSMGCRAHSAQIAYHNVYLPTHTRTMGIYETPSSCAMTAATVYCTTKAPISTQVSLCWVQTIEAQKELHTNESKNA